MKENFLLTIVIPVYNVNNYIDKAINSILKVDENIQIILIDDGSTDGSEKKCDYYAKNNKNVNVIHQENSGPSVSRNYGIKKALGKYIMFLDSDDFYDTNSFIKLIELLKKIDVDVVLGSKYTLMYPKETMKIKSDELDEMSLNGKDFLEKYLPDKDCAAIKYIWMNVYNTKMIQEKNMYFNEKMVMGEDTDWNLRVIKDVTKIYICKINYYNYRGNRIGSISTSFNIDNRVNSMYRLVLNWKKDDDTKNKIIYNYSLNSFCNCLKYVYSCTKENRIKYEQIINQNDFWLFDMSKETEKIKKILNIFGIRNGLRYINIREKIKQYFKLLLVKLKIIDR